MTRLALQNAASVEGLLLTTELMIADAPKDESDHQHGPPGGGMGGMGMKATAPSRSLTDQEAPAGNFRGLYHLGRNRVGIGDLVPRGLSNWSMPRDLNCAKLAG